MAKLGKTHFFESVAFGALSQVEFPPVAALGAAVANTTVQERLAVGQRFKIVKIIVNLLAAAVGAATFNVVVGTGAEAGTVAAKDGVATAGQSVFAADKVITAQTADVPVAYFPDQPDAIYDTAQLLTLRNTTTTSLGAQRISMVIAVEDPKPQVSSANPSTDY
jgi:hypothetical protein